MSAASDKQLSLTDFQRMETRRKQRATYATVEEYLKDRVPSRRNLEIYDNREVRKIANFCSLHPDEVRSQLRRCGYEKIVNQNGLIKWVKTEEETGHEM